MGVPQGEAGGPGQWEAWNPGANSCLWWAFPEHGAMGLISDSPHSQCLSWWDNGWQKENSCLLTDSAPYFRSERQSLKEKIKKLKKVLTLNWPTTMTKKSNKPSPGRAAQLIGTLSRTLKGCMFDPLSGCVWEATLPYFSLSLPLYLKLNKHILGWALKKNNTQGWQNADFYSLGDLIWQNLLKLKYYGPGRCGSVGWRIILSPRGYGFDSRSGHIPKMQVNPQPPTWVWVVQSPVWARVGGNPSMLLSHIDVSPSPSLPESSEQKCPRVRIKK